MDQIDRDSQFIRRIKCEQRRGRIGHAKRDRVPFPEGKFCGKIIRQHVYHADHLIEHYFRRPNYYRIDGKPVFAIYETATFIREMGGEEQAVAALDRFREKCIEAGLPGVHIQPILWFLLPATGSEMNERAVISNMATQQKLNFTTPLVFPKFSILDPEVTYSLPARQVANGVVDSFIHVVEQYLTYPVNAKVQDAFAEGLMRVIHEEGLKVLDNLHDYDIRANLMWAATNALNLWIGQGVPQDWSSHRMGYALTAQFGLDHAQTLSILLPGVMTYMFEEKKAKLVQMGANVFGITEGTDDERAWKTIASCEAFFKQMGLKTRLGECGIEEKDVDALAALVDEMGWHLGEHHNIDSRVAKEIMLLRL